MNLQFIILRLWEIRARIMTVLHVSIM
jgi:hypothetical protein